MRFAVDVMLGKLAKWLRVLGFDASIIHFSDRARLDSALSDGFIPVTRREMFRTDDRVVFVSSDHHFEQLEELIARRPLPPDCIRPFSRCILCNHLLEPIPRADAHGRVPDFIFETASDFTRCVRCEKIYWPGSHRGRMLEKLASLMEWNRQDEEGEHGRE